LCDLGLLVQIYYYRWKNARRRFDVETTETTPLLDSWPPVGFLEKWASIQHYVSVTFVLSTCAIVWLMSRDHDFENQEPNLEESIEWLIQLLGWSSAILYRKLVGLLAYLTLTFVAQWSLVSPKFVSVVYEIDRPLLLIVKLGKNLKTRTQGLSPALFMWVVSGNVTFALSVWAAASSSKDPRYWTTNASWLAGVCSLPFWNPTFC
jgi:hypothetical protein